MTTERSTILSLMQQNTSFPTFTSATVLPSSLQLATTVLSLTFMLLLVVTPVHACPISCECTNTTVLEVSCKNGRILNIFTHLDNRTYALSLDNVVNLQNIQENLIHDLKATEIVKLQITSSFVKEIEENAFLQLEHLEDLDLSRNELATIYGHSFAGLTGLKYLNLSHNQLAVVGQSLVLLPNLVKLDLSANFLKDLVSGVFSSQNLLTFLSLDGNPLKNLQNDIFQGLESVKELRLRDCSLVHIDNEVFLSTPALTVIDLGHNRLNTIPFLSSLSKISTLKVIYLDNNDIQALQEHIFEDMQLHSLDLSYNRIIKIDSLAFNNAVIWSLDLSFNIMISLNSEVLKPLGKSVTRLNIAGNPLQRLDSDVFQNLEILETLNMSFCSLESLEHEQLSKLLVLRRLDISHNSLHFLSQSVLDSFHKLDSISLHGNAWVCDCQIKFLRDWLRLALAASKIQCFNHEGNSDCGNMSCTLPSFLQSSQIVQLQDQDLGSCRYEKSTTLPAGVQGAIVASCLGFAIVLLIITLFLWRKGHTHKGLRRVCVPSAAESSHIADEDSKVPPLANCDRYSLTLSDHNFVFRHYFEHLVTDPKLMADGDGDGEDAGEGEDELGSHKERDSLYSSQPSVYSDAGYGMESTV